MYSPSTDEDDTMLVNCFRLANLCLFFHEQNIAYDDIKRFEICSSLYRLSMNILYDIHMLFVDSLLSAGPLIESCICVVEAWGKYDGLAIKDTCFFSQNWPPVFPTKTCRSGKARARATTMTSPRTNSDGWLETIS